MSTASAVPDFGRLILPALRAAADGGFGHEAARIADALDLGVGGFIVFGGTVESVRRLTADLFRRAGRPMLIAADLERGAGQQVAGLTEFPPPLALASLEDAAVVRWAGAVTAQEARAVGINWVLAPVGDLDVLADNPIVQTRAFGDDPNRVASLVRTWIEGCQDAGALACAKHFPGHGRTTVDSHIALPVVSESADTLRDSDLLPFSIAVESGVASMMTAHVAYPALDASGVPATISGPIMAELRERLGFDGLVVTDALIMDGALVGRRESDAAVEAVQAGVDLLLYPNDARRVRDALEQALASGTLAPARLAEAIRRYDRALMLATSATPPVTRGPFDSADALADALLAQGMLRGGALRRSAARSIWWWSTTIWAGPIRPARATGSIRCSGRTGRALRRRVAGRAGVRRAAGMEGAVRLRRRLARRAGECGARRRPDRALRPPAPPAGAPDRCSRAARVASPALMQEAVGRWLVRRLRD